MYWLFLASALVVGYLAGSLNFAIIISTLLGKGDIRTVGNLNPGTASVGRNLGKGWGAVVFFGDVAKAVVPLIIAEQLYFRFGTIEGTAGLMLMGMAVILGHRRPLFFGFKGGAGAGMLLFKNREFKFGRWVAMLIILLTPVTHLVAGFTLSNRIGGVIGLGGSDWERIVAVALLAAYIFLSNIAKAFETIRSGKVDGEAPSERVDHSGSS